MWGFLVAKQGRSTNLVEDSHSVELFTQLFEEQDVKRSETSRRTVGQ